MLKNKFTNSPYKIITWKDRQNTGAIGWIVIYNLVNKVSGGGLFMAPNASLPEVIDLAETMSFKNSLQNPMFGGGKGGIRFDPKHPEAKQVLKRFLVDNTEIIRDVWCTGGDINTSTDEITELMVNHSNIQSPFQCLAQMLENKSKIPINLDQFRKNLRTQANPYLTIDEAITGYGVFKTIQYFVPKKNVKPKIIVQGFGKVGKALCYYAKDYCDIVGVSEEEWYIADPKGIDILKLMGSSYQEFNHIKRREDETSERFLARFLSNVKAEVFCPCAIRYSITSEILQILQEYTFGFPKLNNRFIISGANKVFLNVDLIDIAYSKNITVLPEWLSNAGGAILYMEALKYQGSDESWLSYILNEVPERIQSFVENAKKNAKYSSHIYNDCVQFAEIQRQGT